METYLYPLHKNNTSPNCDQSVITLMKQADFHAKYLTNFAIVKNDTIICTSENGKIDPPTFLSGDIWPAEPGVSIIQEQPIPLFDGKVKGAAVKYGHFLAFFDYQKSQLESNFTWLKYIRYGIHNNKKTYSFGSYGFIDDQFTNYVKNLQWYEKGHWLFSNCKSTSCTVIAIDILQYLKEEKTVTLCLILFITTLTMVVTFLASSLKYWLYHHLPRQVRIGLNCQQLNLNYQPIINIRNKKVVGYEVLCRWQTQGGDRIPPEKFIDIVEKNNQTEELTNLVISKSINELKEAGLMGNFNIAINVFPNDIASGRLIERFKKILPSKYYSFITIELTERKIDNLSALCEGVKQLRELGFSVAIDDFGTGSSNLETLRELQADKLKIDKSFVWGAEKPCLKQDLINHIVNIAKSFRLSIIAEGVETTEQLDLLRSIGVDYSQGYLHSEPVCVKQLANTINK
ncbi:EAL domain-containing protein [Vibrio sp. Of7-15]|uniref:EAL domain-containing protein n=1 Tax=Vibrio sp. Of7-15 TaxID=2724879 RepID=UPI001EF289B6|nr:EAL domain-containing protein [Vibrio sp. Of7-15]MCG7497709.1 EAL domain-containing protein [Vibrio sp. Of7-15]